MSYRKGADPRLIPRLTPLPGSHTTHVSPSLALRRKNGIYRPPPPQAASITSTFGTTTLHHTGHRACSSLLAR